MLQVVDYLNLFDVAVVKSNTVRIVIKPDVDVYKRQGPTISKRCWSATAIKDDIRDFPALQCVAPAGKRAGCRLR